MEVSLSRKFTEQSLTRIHLIINSINNKSGVGDKYKHLLRQALLYKRGSGKSSNRKSDCWILLPGCWCEAAGGTFESADLISAAWLLYYIAAQSMDHVQDHDPDDSGLDASQLLSLATGLFFLANLILTSLSEQENSKISSWVGMQFQTHLYKMCEGQYLDLTTPVPKLEEYWEIIRLKSGIFFELACLSGVGLASTKEGDLTAAASFGYHFGHLVQILDDLEIWNMILNNKEPVIEEEISRTLPYIYALEVLPEDKKDNLKLITMEAKKDPSFLVELVRIIEECGAVKFFLVVIEQHASLARASLESITDQSIGKIILNELLDDLTSK